MCIIIHLTMKRESTQCVHALIVLQLKVVNTINSLFRLIPALFLYCLLRVTGQFGTPTLVIYTNKALSFFSLYKRRGFYTGNRV